jgi:hypothetical protein
MLQPPASRQHLRIVQLHLTNSDGIVLLNENCEKSMHWSIYMEKICGLNVVG